MKHFLIYCFLIGLIEGKQPGKIILETKNHHIYQKICFNYLDDPPLIYDVAVLGAGLFGSATAKYVSEDVEHSVLIGPSESAKHSTDIFGAWFDEGRIAELADSTDPWYTVGEQAINNINFKTIMN